MVWWLRGHVWQVSDKDEGLCTSRKDARVRGVLASRNIPTKHRLRKENLLLVQISGVRSQ